MRNQIVSDSSSNIFTLEGACYTTVPMKIIMGEKEFVDTAALDVRGMVDALRKHKGKSGSSCANAQEWLEAFGDADMVFGVTISRNLSAATTPPRLPPGSMPRSTPARRCTSSIPSPPAPRWPWWRRRSPSW